MNYKEIQDLIKLVGKTELSEFKLEQGDFKISIRTKFAQSKKGETTQIVTAGPAMMPMQTPQMQQMPPAVPDEAPKVETTEDHKEEDNLIPILSPIVGTFYRSPSPDKPSFLNIGDSVTQGSVVCIIEAMKLFNEIESEVSGKIVKVMVDDASPVEYNQVLFLVDPKG